MEETNRHDYNNDAFDGYEAPPNVPDVPIQGTSNEILQTLLSTDTIPKETKEKFWMVAMNDVVLSFQDEKSKKEKMMDYDIMKLEKLKSINYGDYDFKVEEEFGVMRSVLDTRLDRSKGFKEGTKNERILQQSQFTEQKIIQEAKMERRNGAGGFFAGLLGNKGGK